MKRNPRFWMLLAATVLTFGLGSLLTAPMVSAAVGVVCPYRIQLDAGGHVLEVPYCRNDPLGQANSTVTHAVIVIHGTNRDADVYYENVLNPALAVGAEDVTIIIAPQLLLESDVEAHHLANTVLYWNDNWKQGDQSLSTSGNPRPASLSSFAVVDQIIEYLTDASVYPNLQRIVVVGHSAGGQFVNRYAAGNRVHPQVESRGIAVRYVVANPSSYVYLNNERRVSGTLDQFAVPSTSCTSYNRYRYGLENLNPYMSLSGAAGIINQYRERQVAYLLGGDDNDPNHSSLDKSCAAMLEGEHRLERGLIYDNFIHEFYGPSLGDKHTREIVPGVAHSSAGMFASEIGKQYIFHNVPPTLISAGASDIRHVSVRYSIWLDAASAESPVNYDISPSVNVFDAALQADGRTVLLTTSALATGTPYILNVNNVQDRDGNTIATGTQTAFTFSYPAVCLSLPAGQDAYIDAASPDARKGTTTDLRLKTEAGKLQRALLWFDLSAVPAGANVQSAELSLWLTSIRNTPVTVYAHGVSEAWVEPQVTWNHRDQAGGLAWTSAGGSYAVDAASSVTLATTQTNVRVSWPVPELAAQWVGNENLGVLLEAPTDPRKPELKFASRESGTASQRPVLTICYDERPLPQVAITQPSDGATVAGMIVLAAQASDPQGEGVTQVAFYAGGELLGVDNDGSDGWSAAWDTAVVADGSYELRATATNVDGQTASHSITVAVDNVDERPWVSITEPADGATVSGTVLVRAEAGDDRGVQQVAFYAADTLLGVDSDGGDGWSVDWATTTVPDAVHTLAATATDTGGQSATQTIAVTVDNTTPPEPVCVRLQPDGAAGEDAYLKQEKPEDRKGGDSELRVKTEAVKLQRAVLRFDLSAVPAGARLASMALSLWVKDLNGPPVAIYAHGLTETWREAEVTWLQRDRAAGLLWAVAGGSYAAAPAGDAALVSQKNAWVSWNLTALGQDWLDGANDGVILEAPESAPKTEVKFPSSDDGTAANRPALDLCYYP